MAVDALLTYHPGKEVDLGDNSSRASFAIDLFGDNSCAVPLEELVQIAKLGIAGDLDKFPPAADLGALAFQVQPAEVLDDFVELAEVEHNVLNLRLRRCAARCNVGEQVAQCDETDEPLLASARVCGDGELVKTLLAHGLDGFAAGRVRGDGCDRLEAQRSDGGAMEGVVLVCLACGEAAGDVCGFRSLRRGLGEEVVGGEPVVVDEL